MAIRLDDKTKDSYLRSKREIMSEQEIKEADIAIDNFKRGYRYKKNNNLIELWKEADNYWEGYVNLPEYDEDPACNTNIIHPTIEGQVGLLMEQNYEVSATPRTASEVDYSEEYRVVAQWILDKNKPKRRVPKFARHLKKYGTACFGVDWDSDYANGMGKPRIKVKNPAYLIPDPNIIDIEEIQEGEFFAEIVFSNLYSARREYGDKIADTIIPNYNPMEDDVLDTNDMEQKDVYIKIQYWTKERNENDDIILRLREYSGCGSLLYDSFKDDAYIEEVEVTVVDEGEGTSVSEKSKAKKGFYPKAKYPYFMRCEFERDGMIWGKGTVELLKPTQDLINDLDDQIIINARLTGNPIMLISTTSGIDEDKVTNEAGQKIPTSEMNGLGFVRPPQVASIVPQRRDQALTYERQIISRFGDHMTGQKVKGVDTATESASMQQTGMVGVDFTKMIIEDALSEALEFCMCLAEEYWTEKEAFRITDKKDSLIWVNPSTFKSIPVLIPASVQYIEEFSKEHGNKPIPKYMTMKEGKEIVTKEADFDLTVNVGTGMPKNKAFIYQAIKESYIAKAISRKEYRKLLRDYLSLPISETNAELDLEQKMIDMQSNQADMQKKQMENALNGAVQGSGNADVQGLTEEGTVDRNIYSTGGNINENALA